MKKMLAGFILGIYLMACFNSFASSDIFTAAKATFGILINGNEFKSDKPTVVIDGSTYLPLKAIGDVLGVQVNWNATEKRVEVGSAPQTKNEYSFNNPAPLNVVQTITKSGILEKYTGEVAIKEVIRGETANKMVADANVFNAPPDEGYEYLLIKAYFKLTNIEDGALSLNRGSFSLVSNTGKEYDISLIVAPKPQIDATLYAGASNEGWLVYAVKKDDLKPKIVFEKEYDGTGGIWFKGWID